MNRNTLILIIVLISVCISHTGKISAQTSLYPDSKASAFESRTGDSDLQTMDSMFSLYQPYLENISAYKPMYFLAGVDPEESKFQISLKYRFFNPKKQIAQKHPWARQFFLGYTQTSFWDLGSASQPFKDTSYKPEIFFFSPNLLGDKNGISRLFVQAGFQHESNGRGGLESRSTNYAYIRPIFIWFHEKTRLGVQVAPKLWVYAGNDDDTNRDLYRYRGYFDLEIKAGRAEGLVLGSHFRWAEQGASMQLDATYPLHRLLPVDIDVYLQAQYVNALAESLLNYRERNRAVRIGISIVR
jgi:outer membrane phospholipase A